MSFGAPVPAGGHRTPRFGAGEAHAAPRTADEATAEKAAGEPVAAAETRDGVGEAGEAERVGPRRPQGADGQPLDEAELREVQQLKRRDREVRAHEMAHVAAGGQYVTGGPTYSYQAGPDGRRYAVGGELGISTSPERTPEATIQKAQTIRRAALAPAEPSGQDRAVAAQASKMEQASRAEIRTREAAEVRRAAAERKARAAEAEAAADEAAAAEANEGDAAEATAAGAAPAEGDPGEGAGQGDGAAPAARPPERPTRIPAEYARGGPAAPEARGGLHRVA